MSKERLEEIKKKFDLDRIRKFVDTKSISPQDLIYLVQQAERVQELETTVDFYQSALRDADRRVQELEGTVKHAMKAIDNTEAVRVKLINAEQQNKRYREAIEVAIQNIVACKNLGVKFALKILEQALEGEDEE